MAKPFYKVSIKETGEELQEYGLESLTFDKSTEKDNLLTLQFTNVSDDFIDKGLLEVGTEITFVYGIEGGYPDENVSSGKRLAKISKVKRSYSGMLNNITVYATDLGAYLKKVRSKKVWNGTTASIVQEIASLHGMTAKVSDTNLTHKNLPQGNRTYYDFLQYLASIEKDGDVVCYVTDNEIYVGKRKLGEKSKVTYSRQDPNGKLIDFKVEEDEMSNFGGADSVKSSTIDTKKGETKKEVVNNSNIKNDVKTQKYNVNYDQNGKLRFKDSKDSENASGKTINSPKDDDKVTQNYINNHIKTSQLNGIKATLQLSLEPQLEVNTIISIEGYPMKDIGNYLVVGVKDVIRGGAYGATTVELKRAAVGKAKQGEKTKAKVNTTTGDTNKVTSKKKANVVYYDNKGKEIRRG